MTEKADRLAKINTIIKYENIKLGKHKNTKIKYLEMFKFHRSKVARYRAGKFPI
jgi:hypothetical protein